MKFPRVYIYIYFFFPLVSADSVQLCNFHRNQRRARRKRSLLVCKTLVEKGRCTSGSDQASTIDFRPSQNFPSFSFFLPLAFFLFRLPVRISAPNRSPYFNGSGYIMCSTRVPFPQIGLIILKDILVTFDIPFRTRK